MQAELIDTIAGTFVKMCIKKMQIKADGKMKNFIFSKNEEDILSAFRNRKENIPLVKRFMADKASSLGGQAGGEYQKIDTSKSTNPGMINIGG